MSTELLILRNNEGGAKTCVRCGSDFSPPLGWVIRESEHPFPFVCAGCVDKQDPTLNRALAHMREREAAHGKPDDKVKLSDSEVSRLAEIFRNSR